MNPTEIHELLLCATQHDHAGRVELAEEACRSILHPHPDHVVALRMLGVLLMKRGRAEAGTLPLRRASELAPSDAGILGNFGSALVQSGQRDEGLAVLRRAAELAPQNPVVTMQLCEGLWFANSYDDAYACALRAVESSPHDARALLLLGNSLHALARFTEAGDAYRRALQFDPDAFEVASNLALTHLKMGEARRSLELYDELVSRWPEQIDLRVNRSLVLLALGELERGFAEYELRGPGALADGMFHGRPRWDGSDPSGKTILLASEQGAGDVIHFLRYANMLADRGAYVLVVCAPELIPVAATVAGLSGCFAPGESLPPFDMYLPLASLPAVFHTALPTIPAAVPYVGAERTVQERWRARLGPADNRLRVGIAWAGAPQHLNDRARSCRLSDFGPLAGVPGVALYSLQKGEPAAELAQAPHGARITPLGEELSDYGETAAVMSCLDLVISVDTSIVHLAGALARPVWTLLAVGPDWRWLLGRDDSPWYPTMRLYRQQQLGDWNGLMRRVVIDLSALVSSRRSSL